MNQQTCESQSISTIVSFNNSLIPPAYRKNDRIFLEVYQEVMWKLLKHMIIDGIEPPTEVAITKNEFRLVLHKEHWWGLWDELGLGDQKELVLFRNTLHTWLLSEGVPESPVHLEILSRLSPLTLTLFAFTTSTCRMFEEMDRPNSFSYRPTELTEYWYKKAGLDRFTSQRYEEFSWFWPFCDWARLRKKSRGDFYRTFYYAFFLPLRLADILPSRRISERTSRRHKPMGWDIDPAAYARALCDDKIHERSEPHSGKTETEMAVLDTSDRYTETAARRLSTIVDKLAAELSSQLETELLPLITHTANARKELDSLRQAYASDRGGLAIEVLDLLLDPMLRNIQKNPARSTSSYTANDIFQAKLQSKEWGLVGKIGSVLGETYDNNLYAPDEALRKLPNQNGSFYITRPGLTVGDVLLLKGHVARSEK
ncbi:hypothetical protein [Methylovulum psychrotolerans]|uniref:Uncharacterized protein n=1 Tax=Methylovulum psychrotolerans TaxID=1704499 RepID=A0A2S5CFU1_9GAMM|nr:hypothetical protein [Methylovulum psychrotolerans]POZ49674.1 hypothetical protein AADEFJLK_04555 [Methylovulum psychrotolerans]